MAAPVYATAGEYAEFTGEPVPGDFNPKVLVRASRRIDRVLIGAIYATDDTGMPTDPKVLEAIREATCAQAQYWDELGDASGQGTGSELGEVEIGALRLRRSGNGKNGSGADPARQLSPVAADILRTAGLWPTTPYQYG